MQEIYLGSSSLNDTMSLEKYGKILAKFEMFGGKVIDTATNYPINRDPKDFMLNVKQLYELMQSSKMLVKLGAASNRGDSDNLINVEYLTMQRDYLIDSYGDKIYGFGIHWDSQIIDRQDICKFLEDTYALGFAISLSGIRNYEAYSRYLNVPVEYQIRSSPCDNHASTAQDLRYLFKDISVVGYGLFGGKSKRCGEVSTPTKEILGAVAELDKIIIMPSTIKQLEEYYV